MYGYGYNKSTSASLSALPSPPEDTVTCMSFTNDSDPILLASSWDGSIHSWKKDEKTTSTNWVHLLSHQESAQAILRFCFGNDQNDVFFSTTAGTVKKLNLSDFTVGKDLMKLDHPFPINGLGFCKEKGFLVVGAMNGVISFYDPRDKEPILPKGILGLQGYHLVDLAVGKNTAFFATTNMQMGSIDIRQPTTASTTSYPTISCKNIDCLQESQITSIAAKPEDDGFMTGSIQGRVEIHSQNQSKACDITHRDDTNHILYSANCVALNDTPLGMSGGGDGQYHFYNYYDGRPIQKPGATTTTTTRTTVSKLIEPITACCLSKQSEFCAYATGEDWSKGYEEHESKYTKVSVYVKPITPADKGQQKTTTYNSTYYNKDKK